MRGALKRAIRAVAPDGIIPADAGSTAVLDKDLPAK